MAFQETTYEQIRRARAKALRDELMGASKTSMDALGAFDKTQKAEAETARSLEDRKLKQERDAAEELRRVAEEGRAVSGEKRADAQEVRAAARDAEAVANNAILRKKREADIAREDEAARRVLREKTIEDTAEKARAKMGAGLSKSELEAMAKEAGITPEELDMRALEAEEKRGVLRRKSSLDEKKTESEITKNEALAKKALRPPAAKPVDPAKAEKEKQEAEIRRLRAEVLKRQAAENDLNAPTPQTVNKAQEQRRVLGEVKRLNQTIRNLQVRYPNIDDYVGTLDATAGEIASALGISSNEAENVKSTIRRAFDEYKVNITGAAASDKEMESLMRTVPNMNDKWQDILAKMEAGDSIANEKLSGIDRVLATKDTRAYDPAFVDEEFDALPDG